MCSVSTLLWWTLKCQAVFTNATCVCFPLFHFPRACSHPLFRAISSIKCAIVVDFIFQDLRYLNHFRHPRFPDINADYMRAVGNYILCIYIIHVHTSTHMRKRTHTDTSACMYMYMYMCAGARACVRACLRACVRACVRPCVHKYKRIQICSR